MLHSGYNPNRKRHWANWAALPRRAAPRPLPLLVLGSRQDYLFGASILQRTAAHYQTETVILEQGCHDLMLDPDWANSAGHIADWLAAQSL